MSDLEETVTKTKNWTAWNGSTADLTRLLRLVESPVNKLAAAHIAKSTKYERNRLKEEQDRLTRALDGQKSYKGPGDRWDRDVAASQDAVEHAKASLADAETEARADLPIELSHAESEGDLRRVKGTAEELGARMEGRTFESLDFSAPNGRLTGSSISLEMIRKHGVHLRVHSNDSTWAISTFSELDREISKQVPKYAFLRHWLALYLTFSAALLFLAWSILNAFSDRFTTDGKFEGYHLVVIAAIYLCVLLPLTVWLPTIVRKAIPAVEVVSAGQSAKLKSVGKVLLALPGSIMLGVGINALSSVL